MQFPIAKQTVVKYLTEIEALGNTLGFPEKVKFVPAGIKNLEENKFTVVIAGEFARGKTTFLKALASGLEFLPDAIQANTGVVTSVEYSEDPEKLNQFEIIFKDGSPSEVLPISEIQKYNEENPSLKKSPILENIEKIRVWSNLEFLKEGIHIVDTPGLGSVYEHHREITYDQITKSDACIFLMSIRNAAGASEVSFLKDIQKYLNKVFFILNNCDIDDLLKNEQVLAEEVDKIHAQLKNQDISNFDRNQIYPVSSQWGFAGKGKEKAQSVLVQRRLDSWDQYFERVGVDGFDRLHELSGFKHFEQAFTEFIYNGEKAKQVLMAPIKRILNCLADFKSSLDLRLHSLNDDVSIEELEEKIKLIHQELTVFEKESDLSLHNTETQFKDIIKNAEAQAREQFGRARARIKTELRQKGASFDQINNQEYRRLIDDKIIREINKVIENLVNVIQIDVNDLINTQHKKDQQGLEKIIEGINQDFNFSIPNIQLPKVVFNEDSLNVFDEKIEKERRKNEQDKEKIKQISTELEKDQKALNEAKEEAGLIKKDVSKIVEEVSNLKTLRPPLLSWQETVKIGDREIPYEKVYYEKKGWFDSIKFWPHEKRKVETKYRKESIYGTRTYNNSEEVSMFNQKIVQEQRKLREYEEYLESKLKEVQGVANVLNERKRVKEAVEIAQKKTEEAIKQIEAERERKEKEMKQKEIERFLTESEEMVDSLIDNQINFGKKEISKNLLTYFKIFKKTIRTEYSNQIEVLKQKFDQLYLDKNLRADEKEQLISFISNNQANIELLQEKVILLETNLADN